MREQPRGLPDMVALVASIKEYHIRVLRAEGHMHEWAIVSREIIAQSREFLVAVEKSVSRGGGSRPPSRCAPAPWFGRSPAGERQELLLSFAVTPETAKAPHASPARAMILETDQDALARRRPARGASRF